jgi:hypothetical protein
MDLSAPRLVGTWNVLKGNSEKLFAGVGNMKNKNKSKLTYILDANKAAIPCTDLFDWGRWMKDTEKRRVGDITIDDAQISTVFMGLDHNFSGGEPLLFETMIFGGEHDQYQERCSTWEQAVEMHDRVVRMVKNGK